MRWDALFAVMQADMSRMWREIFPKMLAQFEGTGALTITVTDAEVVMSSAKPPKAAVYRVERKRRLHQPKVSARSARMRAVPARLNLKISRMTSSRFSAHLRLDLVDQPVDRFQKFISISLRKLTPLFFTDVEIVGHWV